MLLAIVWLFACQPEEPPPPPNVEAAMASVIASLDEAARLDIASQDEDARTSWRRAHTEFDTIVEPALRTAMPSQKVTAIELRFGLFRAALERKRGSSRHELRRLKRELEEGAVAFDALTAEPVGATDAQEE